MFTKTLDQLSSLRSGKKKSTMSEKIMGAQMMGAPLDPGTKQPVAPSGQSMKDKAKSVMNQFRASQPGGGMY